VKMSEGWRSSIRKLPPVTALTGAEVVAVAMFEDAPVFGATEHPTLSL
jgi:hypothetical protein